MNGSAEPSGIMGAPGTVAGSVPVPDPTRLTTDAVAAATREWAERLASQRELFEARLTAMDRATELVAERIQEAMALVTTQLRHLTDDRRTELGGLKDLIGERIDGIDRASRLLAANVDKFPSELDRSTTAMREIFTSELSRAEQVTDRRFAAIDGTFASNALALTAALAAQKEAAAETNKSNTLAIDRANAATKETILANQSQTAAGLSSQAATMADLKDRVVRIESLGVGAAGQRADIGAEQVTHTASAMQLRATISLFIAGLAGLVALVSLVALVLKK
jgi:hypothetical protein